MIETVHSFAFVIAEFAWHGQTESKRQVRSFLAPNQRRIGGAQLITWYRKSFTAWQFPTFEHVDNFGEPVEIYTMDNAIEYRITVESFKQAKEQSCSTLCHPEEECFITESGKCEAKEE